MNYLLAKPHPKRNIAIQKIWLSNPNRWQGSVIEMGPAGRNVILPILNKLNETQLISASAILGKISKPSDIPLIESVAITSTPLSKKSLKDAIDAIQSR